MNAQELTKALQEVISEEYDTHEFMELVELNEKVVSESETTGENYATKDRKILNAVGAFEQVEHKRTGSEADIMRYVYHFKDHNIYLCIDGRYSSWDGTHFDRASWYEVKPEVYTTTRYKRVK